MSKLTTTFKTATSMDEEAHGDDCLLPQEGDKSENQRQTMTTNDSSPLTTVERVAELSFCLALAVSGVALEGASLTPRIRPIPYQLLESGDYIINQIFNANFDGETVPGDISFSFFPLFLVGDRAIVALSLMFVTFSHFLILY